MAHAANPTTDPALDLTSGLPAAIKYIQRTAVNAADLRAVPLTVPAGAGKELEIPVLVLPNGDGGMRHQPLTAEVEVAARLARALRLQDATGPDSRTGTAKHQALSSLIDHANRFKSEASAVWADASARKLVTVLDYHPKGAASSAAWGRHRGEYIAPLSEAWTAWGGEKGLQLSQEAFADLLDSRDRELSSGTFTDGVMEGKPAPKPTDLITLASQLEVFSTATARRERDQSGRVKVSFTEEKGVAGSVAPPAAFLIYIRVFEDSALKLLELRLRVTVEEGQAKFHVRIHDAGEVLRDAFEDVLGQVRDETELPVFIGTPE